MRTDEDYGRYSDYRSPREYRKRETSALGLLLKIVAWGLVLLAGWLLWIGVDAGMTNASNHPGNDYAAGAPVVSALMFAVPTGLVGLVFFVLARVADRR